MKVKLYLCSTEPPVAQNPLGLGYLASNVGGEIVHSRAELTDCDMIGLSSDAEGLKEAVSILESAEVPVIIGGQGTLWPGLAEYGFQNIIIGEGEAVFKAILQGIPCKKVQTPANIADIDSLEFPDRGECGQIVPMITSRGCPFHCRFCSSQEYWGGARYHSAGYFIEEVGFIALIYPRASMLYIQDDLFIGDKNRLREIHRLWLMGNWSARFKTRTMIRADLFDEEAAALLADMNPDRVRFGAESGSDRILKSLGKTTTVEDNRRAVDLANRHGIPISASFMYGCPGETQEDRDLTAAFIARNRGRLAVEGWYQYTSFPGAPMYDGKSPLTHRMTCRRSVQ